MLNAKELIRIVLSVSYLTLAFAISLSATLAQDNSSDPAAAPKFSGTVFKDHVRYLASDELAGRWPGTEGGRKAAAYIAEQFVRIDLDTRPGHDNYYQPVPLVGSTISPASVAVTVHGDGPSFTITGDDLIPRTGRTDCRSCEVSGQVIFAGYGVAAPEYGWNDYSSGSLEGKIVLLLPGLPPAAKEVLPGDEFSYYAEDFAKLEAARRRGAAGVIFLMEPGEGEDFEEMAAEWRQEFIQRGWLQAHPLSLIGMLSPGATAGLLKKAGVTLQDLMESAAGADFTAREIGMALEGYFSQTLRRFTSPNVVGIVRGSDPDRGTIVVTAHWDHYGVGVPNADGDTIYNGAKDNASGVAGLILLAEAMKFANPVRNVVFLATTAEEADYEQIGASYYIDHPALPIEETVLNLNLDGIDVIWPLKDFRVLPMRETTAEPVLRLLATPLGRVISEAGWLPSLNFSFDTAAFMAEGIAGLTLWGGSQYDLDTITTGELQARYDRMGGRIHKPSDEFHEDWSEEAIENHLSLYWAALEYWASGAPVPEIVPNGAMAPLMETGAPPYGALAKMIVDRLALAPGEKVLALCHPTHFQNIVPHLRYAVMRTGAANLGCLQVLPQPFPEEWESEPLEEGFYASIDAMKALMHQADAIVALPGTWPNQSAYLAMQQVLEEGHGRAVHFHWLGGYTPEQKQLPVSPRLDRTYTLAVLETDYTALAAAQRRFVKAARAGTIRITTPAGTDIRFRLGRERPVNIQDGDASAARVREARTLIDREIEIPPGAVRFAPIEETVEGVIVYPDSYWNGVLVRLPRLTFEDGVVVDAEAAENLAALEAELNEGGDTARRFRAFALGFNPNLMAPEEYPWIPYYGYGAGVVRLSLGDNTELGGSVRGGYVRWNFFTDATVEIDGEVWVQDGHLAAISSSR